MFGNFLNGPIIISCVHVALCEADVVLGQVLVSFAFIFVVGYNSTSFRQSARLAGSSASYTTMTEKDR